MRKFITVITFLLMIVLTMSGCAFLSVDKVRFYSATVATVAGEKISRKDLLEAFNSYGYDQYVTEQKLSETKALEMTLDNEINKKLLLKYADSKNMTLDDDEEAYLWNETYTYMNNILNNYKDKALKILDITEPVSPSTPDPDLGDWKAYEAYEKRADVTTTTQNVYVGGVSVEKKVYKISYQHEHEHEKYTLTGWENFAANIGNERVLQKCMELAAADLIESEKNLRDQNGKKFSTDLNEVLERKAISIYENLSKYQLMEKIRDDFLGKYNFSPEVILNKYKELAVDSYLNFKPQNNIDNVDDFDPIAAYNAAMVGDSANPSAVFYHPNNDYFYVNNLLLGFNTEQLAKVKTDKELMELGVAKGGISKAEYKKRLNDLASEIVVNIRDSKTGEIVGSTTPDKVLAQLQKDVTGGNTNRAQAFNNAIYKYNTDPGMFNASTPYIDSKDNSSMVDEFNEEGVKLDEIGQYGKISGLVLTEFGYHILFYAGKVNPSFNNSALNYSNIANVTLQDLVDTIVDYKTGKTMFDVIFDIVYPESSENTASSISTSYATYESALITLLRGNYKIKIYSDVLKTSLKLS